MKLDDAALASLTAARIFTASNTSTSDTLPATPVTSLHIHPAGDLSVITTPLHLSVISLTHGTITKTIPSKKYGCGLGRFTHHTNTLLHTSTQVDHAIRYVSLHDVSYLRYFKGHTDTVTSMEIHPTKDIFMSASKADHTVRLWDIRTPDAVAMIQGISAESVAYDPAGGVFCVATSQEIRLLDDRQTHLGPFAIFRPDTTTAYSHVQFSPNGRHLLLSTADAHILLDALNGAILQTIPSNGYATFTPDSKYISMTWDDNNQGYISHISIDTSTTMECMSMHEKDGWIQWSPTLAVMMTAYQDHVVLWQPLDNP